MTQLASIERFLQGKRIALVGVSARPEDFSRAVYTELVKHGYDVVPVRPDLAEIDGVSAYARLQDVPGQLDGAILMTAPNITVSVVHDCAEAHVPRVWMHRGVGQGAVDPEAVRFCQAHAIDVIEGECPLMFLAGDAGPHKAHAAMRRAFGTYPPEADRQPPSLAALLAHGVFGWALCAAAMGLLMAALPNTLAVWGHALAAPALFGIVAARYFKRNDTFSPVLTASAFVAIVVLLDLGVVAGLALQSLEMFQSFVGVWLPLLLIFAVTLMLGAARKPGPLRIPASLTGAAGAHDA